MTDQVYRELFDRLGRLEQGQARMLERMESIKELLECHDISLHGSGGTPGLLTRIDRIEQLESSRKWAIRTAVASLVAAAVAAGAAIFGGKNP